MSEAKIHVVFEPLSTLLQVIDVADDNGWRQVEHFKRGERQVEELVFELPDGDTVVRGIDDHFVVVTFAAITGPARHEVEKKLRSGGRALTEATLWQWTESNDPNERAFALRAFAATSQKAADPRVVALYQAALDDPRPEVRTALVESVGRAAWRELWPVVDAIAKTGDAESKTLQEAYEEHFPRSR
jgi:hypothetical protein